jgi:hypothetical protein
MIGTSYSLFLDELKKINRDSSLLDIIPCQLVMTDVSNERVTTKTSVTTYQKYDVN